MARIVIEPAYRNLEDIRQLFAEYAASLAIDLGFQRFDDELRQLPGKYAPPRGRLFIATVDGKSAGCVALRPFDDDRCEMKRLYVRDAFRGLGIGRLLAQRIVDEAAAMGYGSKIGRAHV